jgi:hypothetical protein
MMCRVAAVVVLSLTAACATQGPLSHDVEYCCGPKGTALATYDLTLVAVPAFLAPTLRDPLVAALKERGLEPSDKAPDALITLSYSAVYAESERPLANDGFSDPLSVGGPRKYEARVTLDVRRASDGAEVLRGVLSREHRESVGDYGHERGREEIRDGFEALLKRLPAAPRRS